MSDEVKKEDVKMVKLMTENEIEAKWNDMTEEERNDCCLYQKLSVDFVTRHQKTINFKLLSINPNITFEILDKFSNRISWVSISLNGKILSDTFIANYANKIVWSLLLSHQQLNLKLLVYLSEKYRKNSRSKQARRFWDAVSRYQRFEVDYVDVYKRYLNFNLMSANPYLNDEIIDEYAVQLNPEIVLRYHTLSEEVMRKHLSLFSGYLDKHTKIND